VLFDTRDVSPWALRSSGRTLERTENGQIVPSGERTVLYFEVHVCADPCHAEIHSRLTRAQAEDLVKRTGGVVVERLDYDDPAPELTGGAAIVPLPPRHRELVTA
jgi:hypothetical protein